MSTKKDVLQMPPDMRQSFGDYGPQIRDGWSGEPIGWGHKLLHHLGEQQWKSATEFGDLEYGGSPGLYFLITRWLTPNEAREKYGEVSELKLGPQGGFKGVQYGQTGFLSRRLDPRK